MAKIEHGRGILISVDTDNNQLQFREIRRVSFSGQPPPKEWNVPYALDWVDQQFYNLVGNRLEYVTSDGKIVSLKPY